MFTKNISHIELSDGYSFGIDKQFGFYINYKNVEVIGQAMCLSKPMNKRNLKKEIPSRILNEIYKTPLHSVLYHDGEKIYLRNFKDYVEAFEGKKSGLFIMTSENDGLYLSLMF